MEVLSAVALVVLLLVVTMLIVVGVLVGLAGWRLDVRNRVDAKHSSPAPLSWLIAPTEAANLHRRLRDAATATRRLGPVENKAAPGTTDDLRIKILEQAALLDRDVVSAGRTPRRHRRQIMPPIRTQVREIESLSRRVAELSLRARGDALPPGVERPEVALREIADRVALLEHAEAELADVERASGLIEGERLLAEGIAERGLPGPPKPGPPGS